MALILASRSPRRRELLSMLTPDFVCEEAALDEHALTAGITDPARVVTTLA
ncbi:MAG: Maf family protein, partial [Oscillospiraceae bacterium]|nr:Maf family protein [Oscillospiraceae bacterium]